MATRTGGEGQPRGLPVALRSVKAVLEQNGTPTAEQKALLSELTILDNYLRSHPESQGLFESHSDIFKRELGVWGAGGTRCAVCGK